MVKHLPTIRETWVQSLGWEDPLEKEMATHSSTIAWKIPWTEEPGRLSPWGHKESDTTERLHLVGAGQLKKKESTKEKAASAPLPSSALHYYSKHFTNAPVHPALLEPSQFSNIHSSWQPVALLVLFLILTCGNWVKDSLSNLPKGLHPSQPWFSSLPFFFFSSYSLLLLPSSFFLNK